METMLAVKDKAPATDRQWQAIMRRDVHQESAFVFAVKTTGVYCRSSCPSRRPKRTNVVFYQTPAQAREAGYRACRRCQPDGPSVAERRLEILRKACRIIDEAEEVPTLNELATALGVSPSHFHRQFKGALGVTPKQYAAGKRVERLQAKLEAGRPVADAIYESGFGSSTSVYAGSKTSLGMSPAQYRAGGENQAIRYTVVESELGWLLVAATEVGVCSISFGNDRKVLLDDLDRRFPAATITRDDDYLQQWVVEIAGFARTPERGLNLPLDIRGTAFQRRVWQALQEIPRGETATYQEIAHAIGKPSAHRAVANACGANPVALAIPCHRVLRKDGRLGGYRWGPEHKRELLRREQR